MFPFNCVTDNFESDFWLTPYHNVSGRPEMLTAANGTTLEIVEYIWQTKADCGWITYGRMSFDDNRAGRNGAQWNRYTTHDGVDVLSFNCCAEDGAMITASYANDGNGWKFRSIYS